MTASRTSLALLVSAVLPVSAALAFAQSLVEGPYVSDAVPALSMEKDLRELAEAGEWQPGDPVRVIPEAGFEVEGEPGTGGFPGLPPASPSSRARGDVGRQLFVQLVDDAFAVFDKDGEQLTPAVPLESFFGPDCARGDVRYDSPADRWVLAGVGASTCFAVTKTADPLEGGWNLYRFEYSVSPPDARLTLWGNAYYVSAAGKGGHEVMAFQRDDMLSGRAARSLRMVMPDAHGSTLLADSVGRTPPGELTRVIGIRGRETFEVYLDWDRPEQSTVATTEFALDERAHPPFTYRNLEAQERVSIAGRAYKIVRGKSGWSLAREPAGVTVPADARLDPEDECVLWSTRVVEEGARAPASRIEFVRVEHCPPGD